MVILRIDRLLCLKLADSDLIKVIYKCKLLNPKKSIVASNSLLSKKGDAYNSEPVLGVIKMSTVSKRISIASFVVDVKSAFTLFFKVTNQNIAPPKIT